MRTATHPPDAEAVPPAALVAATAAGDTAARPVCGRPPARRA
ncbi:MAG TPA: hypothetical protein VFL91_11485 [Thermomicrobiales bacterium]|nr:hypothetical protein [Thermomicrobiales bacterium]